MVLRLRYLWNENIISFIKFIADKMLEIDQCSPSGKLFVDLHQAKKLYVCNQILSQVAQSFAKAYGFCDVMDINIFFFILSLCLYND